MQVRQLGSSGPQVSAIALGCMGMSGIYGPADRAESIATIHAALDAGVNLLDTGDFYGMGHNELLIARGAHGRRRATSSAQREVRRPARPGRRLARLRRAAGGGEELPRLHAAAARRRPHRHLPPGAARPATCRSRRPIGAIADMVKAGYVRAHRPLRGRRRDHPPRRTRCIRSADLQIEYSLISRGIEDDDPADLPRARHRRHRLRRAVARPDQRPLAKDALGARRLPRASARASRARTSSTTSRWSRRCARSPRRGASSVAQLAIAWVAGAGRRTSCR